MQDGELLLMDMACEYAHYATDITRTMPVNGHFSAEQRKVYDVVLAARLVNTRRQRSSRRRHGECHQSLIGFNFCNRYLTGALSIGTKYQSESPELTTHFYRPSL
jgi:hypothetical protein